MQEWERAWLNGKDAWQEEIDQQPGIFSGGMHMLCLDEMGPEDFISWYRRQAAS